MKKIMCSQGKAIDNKETKIAELNANELDEVVGGRYSRRVFRGCVSNARRAQRMGSSSWG
jgi:hypothetical protein